MDPAGEGAPMEGMAEGDAEYAGEPEVAQDEEEFEDED